MTIDGVKKHLNQNKSNLDDSIFTSIRTKYFKNKLTKIKNIIKEFKKIVMAKKSFVKVRMVPSLNLIVLSIII